MYYELTDHFVVRSDANQTWDFFSQAENLPKITPPWLGFKLRTSEPIVIQNDSLLDYTIQWMGIPIHWRTRIIEWSPPRQFIDLQIRGPYALWHHQHTFNPVDGGTECRDRVIYKVPFPLLGRLVNHLIVRKQLFEIFRFRRKVIAERLGLLEYRQPDVEIRAIQ